MITKSHSSLLVITTPVLVPKYVHFCGHDCELSTAAIEIKQLFTFKLAILHCEEKINKFLHKIKDKSIADFNIMKLEINHRMMLTSVSSYLSFCRQRILDSRYLRYSRTPVQPGST